MHADDKKILQVKVDRLVGSFDETEEDNEEEQNDNPLRSFLKRNLGGENGETDGNVSDSDVDDELERARAENTESARLVEAMVDSGKSKRQAMSEIDDDSP